MLQATVGDGLLLGAADRRLGLVRRLAGCFRDARDQKLVEHSVATLIGQRVFGIALGYEDLNDHDELRHDPLMAALAGKLRAWRSDCAPAAGKSMLRRVGLAHTQFAEATCGTIRLKLLKLAGLVRISARRIKFALASAYPYADEWRLAAARLA